MVHCSFNTFPLKNAFRHSSIILLHWVKIKQTRPQKKQFNFLQWSNHALPREKGDGLPGCCLKKVALWKCSGKQLVTLIKAMRGWHYPLMCLWRLGKREHSLWCLQRFSASSLLPGLQHEWTYSGSTTALAPLVTCPEASWAFSLNPFIIWEGGSTARS